MSQMNGEVRYVWEGTYQRYYLVRYDYTLQQWQFADWMPIGWQAPQAGDLSIPSEPPLSPMLTHRTDSPAQSVFAGQSAPPLGFPYDAHFLNGKGRRPRWDSAPISTAPQQFQGHQSSSGQYVPTSGAENLHYEQLDPTFFVRDKHFFCEGRVFAVMFSEAAGHLRNPATNFNTNLSEIRFAGNYVHTQVRRFVVVRQKREFCYACPISTYSGKGTTKPGVRPEEHGIAYSVGHLPTLIDGEPAATMPSIPVVMADPHRPLVVSSRIYFGLQHAIQYNVKVKDVGRVEEAYLPILIGNWRAVNDGGSVTPETRKAPISIETPVEEDDSESGEDAAGDSEEEQQEEKPEDEKEENDQHTRYKMDSELAQSLSSTGISTPQGLPSAQNIQKTELELVTNPKGFFKKGRVFMTFWTEQRGFSAEPFKDMARFVVIKPSPTFSVCLRISTYSGQATTKPGVAAQTHAAVVPVGGAFIPYPQGENLVKPPITVKLENPSVSIDPMWRINFAKPYSVEHNIMVRNIGRVVGESVGLLDSYFAESLGYIKP